jgi:hypothetical protein
MLRPPEMPRGVASMATCHRSPLLGLRCPPPRPQRMAHRSRRAEFDGAMPANPSDPSLPHPFPQCLSPPHARFLRAPPCPHSAPSVLKSDLPSRHPPVCFCVPHPESRGPDGQHSERSEERHSRHAQHRRQGWRARHRRRWRACGPCRGGGGVPPGSLDDLEISGDP